MTSVAGGESQECGPLLASTCLMSFASTNPKSIFLATAFQLLPEGAEK
jgi:hypothetical protein